MKIGVVFAAALVGSGYCGGTIHFKNPTDLTPSKGLPTPSLDQDFTGGTNGYSLFNSSSLLWLLSEGIREWKEKAKKEGKEKMKGT